jgi:LacI family transcriptional regulator
VVREDMNLGLSHVDIAYDASGTPETKKRGSRTPTIYDVASRAGVSIASVSRVLNGRASPRPETRDRVMRAVRDLSFVPDAAARALSKRAQTS